MPVRGERFARSALLLGTEALERIRASRVTVAGLGGVGSYAVEALARGGVGFLRVVDRDVVDTSNINRQLLALESTVGRVKVELAGNRIRDINPDCTVEALHWTIPEAGDLSRLFDGGVDAIIDALDDIDAKAAVIAAAERAGVGIVISSMGSATRTDTSLVRVAPIRHSTHCPLARLLRRKLRERGSSGTEALCVYSTEPANNADMSARIGSRSHPMGSFSCLPGIFGLTAANEVLMRLAGLR